MARTERYNDGVWLPLRYDDLADIVHDTETFSSVHDGFSVGATYERIKMPPIHTDPPDHTAVRRTVLPFFAPRRIDGWEQTIRSECAGLAASVAERGRGDAAVDYAQVIPVGAIASILGVDPGDGERFRTWIHEFIEIGARDETIRSRAQARHRCPPRDLGCHDQRGVDAGWRHGHDGISSRLS